MTMGGRSPRAIGDRCTAAGPRQRPTAALACAIVLLGTACARSGLSSNVAESEATAGTGAGQPLDPRPVPDPDPDPNRCRSTTLAPDTMTVEIPGTVLLVFDRSASMAEPWNGEPRWRVAGAAIVNALRAAHPTLSAGAVFFPSPDGMEQCIDPTGIACMFEPSFVVGSGTCLVHPIEASDQIAFTGAESFLAAFEAEVDSSTGRRVAPRHAPVAGGRTPLREALSTARSAIESTTREGLTTVVVVTDGDPNCEWDADAANRTVMDLHAIGIDTYVLGLPGLGDNARSVLARLAASGGTEMFVTPDDAGALERRFGEILLENVSVGFRSCLFSLDDAVVPASDARLIALVRGVPTELSRTGEFGEPAWALARDGVSLELFGRTCAIAMSGAYQALRLEYACTAPAEQ
jgi:hypothetical protein